MLTIGVQYLRACLRDALHTSQVSEPHVAEQILVDMLHEANVTILKYERIVAVSHISGAGSINPSPHIANVTTTSGKVVAGTVRAHHKP